MRVLSWKTLSRTGLVAAAALGAATLSGCYAHDPYGGYTSVSVRSGGPGYYGHRQRAPYWGWRGDYYYPGVGVYVYDRDRHRHRWNDDDRRHWEGRRSGWDGDRRGGRRDWDNDRGNWGDFDRGRGRGRGR
jgi:hypothetical protein